MENKENKDAKKSASKAKASHKDESNFKEKKAPKAKPGPKEKPRKRSLKSAKAEAPKGALRRIGDKKKAETPSAFQVFEKKENPKLERKKANKAAREETQNNAENTEFVSKGQRKFERQQAKYREAERKADEKEGIFGEAIRLNRFIALAGVCARREADQLIGSGKIKVNGKIVKEMGMRVMPGKDKVTYKGETLGLKIFVYLLMNKPKNRIATTDDEKGRDTVMDLVSHYTKARVYPVSQLDRNTTGILLFTNDGDLTAKLTSSSSQISKVYQAKIDKAITEEHIAALQKGFELEDGFAKVEKITHIGPASDEIGLELISGAKHIVERMFSHLGYNVTALDRLEFGPLNKRGLPRGKCRMLTPQEVGFLKMMGKGAK